jgi:hypothetical protein
VVSQQWSPGKVCKERLSLTSGHPVSSTRTWDKFSVFSLRGLCSTSLPRHLSPTASGSEMLLLRGARRLFSRLRRKFIARGAGSIFALSPVEKYGQQREQKTTERERENTQNGKRSCGVPQVPAKSSLILSGPTHAVPRLHEQAHEFLDAA